ncbi:MAG: hypothetical protein O3B45_01535 [Bacteroidetes bacterium]|jgi:hypothetical protein|nr:hypothetical protein [Bacteroidota bacterium]|tara:strand:- start:84 stop:551 length:468 start_codon:yes stop_codon:yes gene_type:complete
MGDKGLRLGLSGLRIAVIVAGILLSYLITSRSGSDETFVEGQERYGALLDGLFYIIYFVGIACAAAAITFGLIFFVSNIKEKMGTLAGVVGFLILGLISFYVLADDTVMRAYEASGITVTAGESMFAGGGLYFVYLLGGLSILTIVAAEVRSALK